MNKNKTKKTKKIFNFQKNKGRPAKQPKYEFSKTDLKVIQDSLLNDFPTNGVDYGFIKQSFFEEKEPAVTNKDIQNVVYNTPHLKNILTDGMKYSIIN